MERSRHCRPWRSDGSLAFSDPETPLFEEKPLKNESNVLEMTFIYIIYIIYNIYI